MVQPHLYCVGLPDAYLAHRCHSLRLSLRRAGLRPALYTQAAVHTAGSLLALLGGPLGGLLRGHRAALKTGRLLLQLCCTVILQCFGILKSNWEMAADSESNIRARVGIGAPTGNCTDGRS